MKKYPNSRMGWHKGMWTGSTRPVPSSLSSWPSGSSCSIAFGERSALHKGNPMTDGNELSNQLKRFGGPDSVLPSEY